MSYEIPRKPVAQPDAPYAQPACYNGPLDKSRNDYHEPVPTPYAPCAVELNQPAQVVPAVNQELFSSRPQQPEYNPALPPRPSEPPVPATSDPGTRSIWKSLVDETVYYAGGLISHPVESTKHYSILRHSPPLIMYRGPSTSITISVFGDAELPPDRTFWLQRKGFSGNMGMAASALMGATSNWIDVTPSVESTVSNVPAADERAWQRDIKNFEKGATKDKRLSQHILRETCVLRIPAVAEDGYLRIVMCTGQSSKKSLCPSPTFRLASTSSDSSVLRGASLATLPLELGIKAVSVIGNSYFQRVVGPAQAVVQSKVKQLEPAFVKANGAMVALAQTGVSEGVGQLEEKVDASQGATYSPFHEPGTFDEPPPVIGSDSGPEEPFPITLGGKIIPGTGLSRAKYNIPTANLTNIPEELLLRLNGIYIGWAAIEPGKNANGGSCDWHEAIITIAPSPHAPPTVAAQRVATVHIVNDFGENVTFLNSRLEVRIMAFLRPSTIPNPMTSPAEIIAAFARDREIAVASLSRDRWHHNTNLQIVACEKEKSFAERYVGFRSQIQKHVDNIPIHWAGVRTERADLKDEAYGRGGFYIRR